MIFNVFNSKSNGVDVTNADAIESDVIKDKTFYSGSNELKTGTLSLEGNAVSNDVLNGKTFYNTDAKSIQTGTIQSKSAATYTPTTNNQTIAAGQYLSGVQTIAGDADLVAANIKTGVNIFNVAGTFTNDATAVAANILSGKTAYVKGTKITGTIASKAAATYTPSTSNQTIAAGQYLSGVQTIAGDADLKAANIKTGVNIFNIAGTYTSDATATAAQILSGKTAYVKGDKVTGTYVPANNIKTATGTVKTSSDRSVYTVITGLAFFPMSVKLVFTAIGYDYNLLFAYDPTYAYMLNQSSSTAVSTNPTPVLRDVANGTFSIYPVSSFFEDTSVTWTAWGV